MVANHAESLMDMSVVSEGSKYLSIIGMPMPTASPPTLAMNMRTDVSLVISAVSRVSEALSAP